MPYLTVVKKTKSFLHTFPLMINVDTIGSVISYKSEIWHLSSELISHSIVFGPMHPHISLIELKLSEGQLENTTEISPTKRNSLKKFSILKSVKSFVFCFLLQKLFPQMLRGNVKSWHAQSSKSDTTLVLRSSVTSERFSQWASRIQSRAASAVVRGAGFLAFISRYSKAKGQQRCKKKFVEKLFPDRNKGL